MPSTLFDRVNSITESSTKQKDAKAQIMDAIKQASEALAKKPLTMIFGNFNPKGFDGAFKEGGQFKIRPKSDGAVLAKLQGQPNAADRWLGVGKSIPEALANMKPEGAEKDAGGASAGEKSEPKPKSKSKLSKSASKSAASEKETKPGPAREVIDGQALHNDAGVDQETFDRYAGALKDAAEMYKRRGFGFMIGNFTMHLRKGKPGILGNFTGAEAKTVNPEVEIFVNNLDKGNHDDIALTMIHEIAHHYYYKEIPRSLRKTYDWYFKRSKEFASDYGKTSRYEDFPEIIAAFVGRASKRKPKIMKYEPISNEMIQRVRTFLGQDKRVNLKAEERNTLFGRLVTGA